VTSIELDELGQPTELPLTAGEGRLLAASEVVTAVPSPYQPGIWQVAAAGKVGTARVGDVTVHVRPKVPVARLLFLLGYAFHQAAWHPDTVPVAPAPDLVPAVAQALWRQTERALHQGLLPGYVTVEESSPVLRGRLRESVQLGAWHGLPLPLEIRHDEFTVDIPENQILRAACARMLAVPRVDDESARMLRRLLREFGDVSDIPRGGPVPSWTPSRLNARYHDALRLASLVLAATAVEHGAGNVAVNGFLIDMPALFERFVTVSLREALVAGFGGRVDDQVRYYFDQAAEVVLRPDIVWQADGAAAAVIDAKYKAEKPAGYPNADLYQLLAYCTILGLRAGHLVYARGNAEPARHVVRQSGIEILCHAIDLSLEPERLVSQMRDLAGTIASTVALRREPPAPLLDLLLQACDLSSHRHFAVGFPAAYSGRRRGGTNPGQE
jgi:5-methylcytosine-specific restriction enzyme subunit McrC